MSPYLWHFTNDTLLELSLRMPPRNDKFNLMNYYCMSVTSVWDTYAFQITSTWIIHRKLSR